MGISDVPQQSGFHLNTCSNAQDNSSMMALAKQNGPLLHAPRGQGHARCAGHVFGSRAIEAAGGLGSRCSGEGQAWACTGKTCHGPRQEGCGGGVRPGLGLRGPGQSQHHCTGHAEAFRGLSPKSVPTLVVT